MAKRKSKHRKNQKRPYSQIINPIHHLERVIEENDKESDQLQAKMLFLTILSIILATAGVLLALFY